MDTLDSYTHVGQFRLNIAGNSNTYGKYNHSSLWGISAHGDTAGESAAGYTLESLVGGRATSNTNSSTSKLVQTNSSSSIHKAYLVIAATAPTQSSNFSYLEEYGVSFKGPKGTIKRYYPSTVYYDNNKVRESFYVDVTDFVKSQGYGTYSCINIPYTSMVSKGEALVQNDRFGSWKLVVIEEDTNLPLRMICLKLGGTSVTKGLLTEVEIKADGLRVKSEPTGELIVSMDGYDIGDSSQQLFYKTSNFSSYMSVREYVKGTTTVRRGGTYFFSAQITNQGKELTNNPTSKPAYSGTTLLTGIGAVYGGGNFNHYNTDLSVLTINDKSEINNLTLDGGETSVSTKISTNNAPTLVSILGLAVDIVVPEFESNIEVTNLTRHYSTSDKGYDDTIHYARENDRLKVTATSTNVSTTSGNIGLKNAELVVEAGALKDVDASTVTGIYTDSKGNAYTLTPTVSGTTITFALKTNIVANKGGTFTVSYEGTAKSSSSRQTYENRVTAQGTFVDDTGTHYESLELGNMGVAKKTTASDGEKYQLKVTLSGSGTVSGSGTYYGTAKPTVTATPSSGSYTKLVLVDGVIRDDWTKNKSNTIQMANSDHSVFVGFAKGSSENKAMYTITTTSDDHIQSLTPSSIVTKGEDHQVTWQVEEGYEISAILIDGYVYPSTDVTKLDFKSVSTDHKVEIQTIEKRAFITTHVIGNGTISASKAVNFGDSYKVTWKADSGNSLICVTVNGKVIYDEVNGEPIYEYLFEQVQEDQDICVEFKKEGQVIPSGQLVIDTQILGGTGTITPSQTVKSGSNVTVSWSVDDGYKIEKVYYYKAGTREELELDKNEITLSNIKEDGKIQVLLKKVSENPEDPENPTPSEGTYSVTTEIYGGVGSITPNRIGIPKGQDYSVTWDSQEGYRIEYVIIDGKVRDDLKEASEYLFEQIDQNHHVEIWITSDKEDKPIDIPGGSYPESPSEDDVEYFRIITSKEGNGTISPTVSLKKEESHTVTWNAGEGEQVLSVVVDGILRNDLLDKNSVEFVDIIQNHTVKVVFSSQSGEEPEEGTSLGVSTYLYGGKGTITPSATVQTGDSYQVSWTVAEGYYVKTLLVDGVVMDATLTQNQWIFEEITSSHSVVVILDLDGKQPEPEEGPELKDQLIRVSTELIGGGTITKTTILKEGDSHQVEWDVEDGWEIYKVYLDDVEQTSQIANGQKISFENLTKDHHVKVVLKKNGAEKPEETDRKYTVATYLHGGQGSITPTIYYAEGRDALVEWTVDEKYEISKIYVDGEERTDLLEDGKICFEALTADHRVEVILIPLKPTDREVEKTVENQTDPGQPTQVHDILTYTITTKNNLMYSLWQDVHIKDVLPIGLELIEDSLHLTTLDGTEVPLNENCYDKESRLIDVLVGDVWGGEGYILTFDVEVTVDAVGKDIGNVAEVSGTDPEGGEITEGTPPVYPEPEDKPEEGGVLYADPEPGVDKTAINNTHDGNLTMVGDLITYTIKVNNLREGSLWKDVVVRDKIPVGMRLDTDSIYLTKPNGEEIHVSSLAYNDVSRLLSVYVGDVYGGEMYILRFDVILVPEAVGEDIGNVGTAGGSKPTKPEGGGGTPETPEGGGGTPEIPEGGGGTPGEPTGEPTKPTGTYEPGDPYFPDDDPFDEEEEGPYDVIETGPRYPWDEENPPEGGTVLPGMPEPELDKKVENETHPDGNTKQYDVLTYRIDLTNPKEGSVWKNVVIFDYLPNELILDLDSLILIHPDGTKEKVSSSVYNKSTHMIQVPIKALYGGETYTLQYKVRVNVDVDEPEKEEIVNRVEATGENPDGTQTEIGSGPSSSVAIKYPDDVKGNQIESDANDGSDIDANAESDTSTEKGASTGDNAKVTFYLSMWGSSLMMMFVLFMRKKKTK